MSKDIFDPKYFNQLADMVTGINAAEAIKNPTIDNIKALCIQASNKSSDLAEAAGRIKYD